MALFGDEDYEGVPRWLTGPLRRMPGCWDPDWPLPTSGGITQARKRLGYEPVKTLFERIAHNAVSSLICTAATETGVDPHRVKFAATVRIVREHIADPDAFP